MFQFIKSASKLVSYIIESHFPKAAVHFNPTYYSQLSFYITFSLNILTLPLITPGYTSELDVVELHQYVPLHNFHGISSAWSADHYAILFKDFPTDAHRDSRIDGAVLHIVCLVSAITIQTKFNAVFLAGSDSRIFV